MLGVCQTEPPASWGAVHQGPFGKDQSHTYHLQTLCSPIQQDKGALVSHLTYPSRLSAHAQAQWKQLEFVHLEQSSHLSRVN